MFGEFDHHAGNDLCGNEANDRQQISGPVVLQQQGKKYWG